MDPQHQEGLKWVGAIAASVGAFLLGLFRFFPTRKEFDTCQKNQCGKIEKVEREQATMAMFWKDDINKVYDKMADDHKEVMAELRSIREK